MQKAADEKVFAKIKLKYREEAGRPPCISDLFTIDRIKQNPTHRAFFYTFGFKMKKFVKYCYKLQKKLVKSIGNVNKNIESTQRIW